MAITLSKLRLARSELWFRVLRLVGLVLIQVIARGARHVVVVRAVLHVLVHYLGLVALVLDPDVPADVAVGGPLLLLEVVAQVVSACRFCLLVDHWVLLDADLGAERVVPVVGA